MVTTTAHGPGSAYGPKPEATVGDTGLTATQIRAVAAAVLAEIGGPPAAGQPRLAVRKPLSPDALARLWASGGSAWDKIDDPAAYLGRGGA